MKATLLETASAPAQKNNLSTLNGCYIPCLLNILGAVLFLRVGFAVGVLGALGALAVFSFSELIAYLTISSFSALVTNGRMAAGGAYYMISRSLGPAFGGSSGLLFWFTYCVNVMFNTVAFTQTITSTFFDKEQDTSANRIAISSGTLFVLFLVALKGAAAFARVNLFIFVCLALSLCAAIGTLWFSRHAKLLTADLSLLSAHAPHTSGVFRPFAWSAECASSPWHPLAVGNVSCATSGRYGLREVLLPATVESEQCGGECSLGDVFGIVFPAVVGMMEGANLSGDLREPGRSIPIGTFAAVSTAFICYLLLIVGQAATVDRDSLIYDMNVMQHACWPSQYLVVLGVTAACLSTALGSMFGSARILQAMARDNLFPFVRFFAAGATAGDEPRRAVVLSYLIAQLGIFIGDLDAVAPILTNFFLVTYTLTNLAAFFLEISGVPNWRPTYRFFSWQTSLLGAALTLAAMVYLNVAFAAITAAVVGAVYAYLSLCFDGSAWADISSALTFRQARAALRRGGVLHAKYWRPVLMLVQPDGPQDAREKLRALCDGLAQTGLLLTAKVHVGSGLPYSPARGGTNAPPTICMRSSSSTVGTATVATTDIASVPTSVSGFNTAHAAPDESTTGVSTSFRNGCAAEPSRASTQSNVAPCTVALSFEQQVVGETWRAAIANLALSAGLGTLTPHTFVLPLPESAPFNLPIANLEEYRATLIDLLCLEKHLLLATNFASSRGSARPSLSAGGEGAASASASASAAPVSPACGCVDVWLFGEMPAEGTAAAAEAHAELALAIQYAHLAVKAEASRRAWPRAARMLSALFRGRNERAPLELEQSRNLSSASSRAGETDTASTSAAAASVCASTATTASASASAAMSLSAPASTPARTAYAPPCAPPMSSGQLPTLRLLQLRLAPTSEQIASGTRLADAQASSALRAWLREARLCGEVRVVSLAAPSLARLHVAGEWAWLADAGAADAVNGCLRAESAAAATSLAMLPMPPFGTATSGAATSGASGSCDAHSAEAAEADLGVLARVAEGLPPVLFCKSASAAPVITRDI